MPASTPPYRLGLVGLGWVVEHAYAPALLDRRSHWIVNVLCDPDPRARARLNELWPNARGCDSIDDLLREPLDAVIIATPNHLHVEQSLAALRGQMSCLCEKPAIAAGADAIRLMAAETHTARYMQATVCRYRSDVGAWLAACRRLGSLARIEVEWLRHRGVPSAGAWHLDPRPGWTGVFADLGYHLIDLVGAALDFPRVELRDLSAVATSSGRSESAAWYGESASRCHAVADRFSMRARFEETAVELAVSWVDETPGDLTRLSAFGENGSAVLEGLFGFSTQRRLPHQRVTRFDAAGTACDIRDFEPGPGLHQRAFGALLDAFGTRVAAEHPGNQSDLGFAGAFIDEVRRKCPNA